MRARLESLAVFAASVVTYTSALGNGFAVDDDFVIAGNSRVHQLVDQAAIWSTPYWPTYGEQLGLYRPLAIFAYALQWAAGDGAPWVFHACSILLHAAVALLVLVLLRRFTGGPAALAGALLFAVHPVHTEVVANAVGQAELLAALAVLGACLLVVSRPPGATIGAGRVAGLATLFALALLAKENVIILPALLIATDLAQRRPATGRAWWAWARAWTPPVAMLGIVAAAYVALRYHVLGSLAGSDAAPWLPFLREDGRIFSALRVWPEYLRLMLFPVDLAADYSPAVILPADGFSPMVALGALIVVLVTLLALLTPQRPAVGLPSAWFLIAVLPVSNLLFPIGVLMAERLLYLPSVALAIGASFLWQRSVAVSSAGARRVAAAAAAAVLALMGARAFVRNPDWKDSAAYYAALLRDHPESYRAQWGEAARRLSHGDRAGALESMSLAHRLWPHDAQLLGELALLHIWGHAYTLAVPLLEQSSRLNDQLPRTWLNLAYVYVGVGRPEDARAAAARAEAFGVNRAETRALTAQAHELSGEWDEAAAAWRESVAEERGRSWTYWSAYARVLARAGRNNEALAAADSARALAPPESGALVESLRGAIASGCYADRGGSGDDAGLNASGAGALASTCTDPLADWAIVTSVNALPPEVGGREAWRLREPAGWSQPEPGEAGR
ncbi:MAG: hypothetical protein L0271_01870 [Gemmatimonadetes bacterium]|nr:hypothetical protein [Gemmatimonadota bacterium]